MIHSRVLVAILVTCLGGVMLQSAPTVRSQVLAEAAAKHWNAALQLIGNFRMSADPELQTDPELFGAVSAVLIHTGNEASYEELLAKQTGGIVASAAFQLATRLAKDGLFSRAIEGFERIPLTDRDEAVFFNLALAQSHTMLFDQARGNYFQAIDRHPALVEAYFHVGLDYASSGSRNLAIPWLLRALQFDPGNAEIFYALSEQLLALGFTGTVSEMLASEIAKHPGSALVKSTQGELALALGDLPAARHAFEQTLVIDPHSVPALIGRGRVAERESDQKAARMFFEQAFSLDPSSPAALELGRIDYANGDSLSAALYFRAACGAICSEETRLEFARALLNSSKPKEALEILAKGTRVEDPVATHHLLSLIYRKLGRVRDAERELHLSQQQNHLEDTNVRFDSPKVYVQ